YLRSLFVGEWANPAPYGDALPPAAPDLLLAATSCHPAAAFWGALARLVRANAGMHCVLVEDDGSEEARTEALATGIQPYVELAGEGIGGLLALVRRLLREIWLGRVTRA
ncbi:MAG TPA: hypothetical protein PK435_08935, partial [Thermoanaerobaculaceae bacterium]|nr:hypothetical protein [Thermoanaerobaculaceae bacterium]